MEQDRKSLTSLTPLTQEGENPTQHERATPGNTAAIRDKAGKFLPGMSGNRNGRPRLDAEVREKAGEHVFETIDVALSIMRDVEQEPMVRLHAARFIKETAVGKATQPVSAPNGPLVSINFGTEPIRDVKTAADVYRQILGDTSIDLSTITFADPEPSAAVLAESAIAVIEPTERAEPSPATGTSPEARLARMDKRLEEKEAERHAMYVRLGE